MRGSNRSYSRKFFYHSFSWFYGNRAISLIRIQQKKNKDFNRVYEILKIKNDHFHFHLLKSERAIVFNLLKNRLRNLQGAILLLI